MLMQWNLKPLVKRNRSRVPCEPLFHFSPTRLAAVRPRDSQILSTEARAVQQAQKVQSLLEEEEGS